MSRYHNELEIVSRPQDRGFSEILDDNNITSSVESVLFPLCSCVQAIQRQNPNLIAIPELIIDPQFRTRGFGGGILGRVLNEGVEGLGQLIGAVVGSVQKNKDDIGDSLERSLKKEYLEAKIAWEDDLTEQRGYMADYQRDWDDEDSAKQEAEQAVDDKAFDLYCKCRQLIDVAKGKLKPEEEAVLNQIISRTAGKSGESSRN